MEAHCYDVLELSVVQVSKPGVSRQLPLHRESNLQVILQFQTPEHIINLAAIVALNVKIPNDRRDRKQFLIIITVGFTVYFLFYSPCLFGLTCVPGTISENNQVLLGR